MLPWLLSSKWPLSANGRGRENGDTLSWLGEVTPVLICLTLPLPPVVRHTPMKTSPFLCTTLAGGNYSQILARRTELHDATHNLKIISSMLCQLCYQWICWEGDFWNELCFMHHFTCWTLFIFRMNRAWLYKGLNDWDRQQNSDLAQLAEHGTDDPEVVDSIPGRDNFLILLFSFNAGRIWQKIYNYAKTRIRTLCGHKQNVKNKGWNMFAVISRKCRTFTKETSIHGLSKSAGDSSICKR